ncbi:hypothetical protein K431DRAFT_225624 [Polychaeton citri CBS 116435]|uniref:LsmAD domain-containing protein n=1 Tax=Polychaeton citri CBS 116435 TaxID=1314669 RepID=A0A9P4UM13_9PEZI|nr:hypothetical protein K431DRAFT_225624 [Polychaeton citri CBS 116435]
MCEQELIISRRRKQQSPQPKAWQGPNPITRGSASSQPNGIQPSRLVSQPQSKPKSEGNAEKHAHDRLLWVVAHFIGQDATITLNNGEQFKGVFCGASLEPSEAQYTLKMVQRIRPPTHQQSNGTVELLEEYVGDGEDYTMTFNVQDTSDLFVPEVVTSQAHSLSNGSTGGSFRTDTEISTRDTRIPRERELKRWDGGGDDGIDMSLGAPGGAGWDQFATNEQLYGVQSTYDENIYTTAINRTDPLYKQREAEAARIAREIEGSATVDAHVAEERRQNDARDDGLDEEEKYSGVKREFAPLAKGAAGSYVPPSRRPITNNPTVAGAPYDPAIISSQLAKPAQAEPAAAPTDAPSPTPVPAAEVVKKPLENTAEDHVRGATDAFRQFANNEKLRIRQAQEQKRTNARNEKNVKLNDLKKFSMNFQLKSRVPDDLVPILAKDRAKQMEIKRKADDAARVAEERKTQEKENPKADPLALSSSTSATPASGSTSTTPYHRSRPSQNMRSPLNLTTQKSAFGIPGQRQSSGHRIAGLPPIEPLPESINSRIPSATRSQATTASSNDAPMSPTKRLNAGAFEFKPSTFQPSAGSPSPQRKQSIAEDFWGKKKANAESERQDIYDGSHYNVIAALLNGEYTEEQKRKNANNGGVPLPFVTPPTWTVPQERINTSYLDAFPKSQAQSQGASPMQTPHPNGPMPHAHQLPPQLQVPHLTPQQHRFFPHPSGPMDPRMQLGQNGSVQNSPRFGQAQMVFGNQMQGMPMQNFAGQPMPAYMPSPSMAHRQMQPPPPNAQMMMMPAQQFGQTLTQGQVPMRPNQYPGGQFQPGMGPMGGQMMMPSASNGPYMNGHMAPQPSFSPMPHHPQPQMHHMQPQGGPAGYSGSPRPPMMQHQGSHQGFTPAGPHMPIQPHFAPSPGHGQHPYPYQPQRQMSGQGNAFPQMTPRQQAAVPQMGASPGQMPATAQGGDEGK